MEKAHTLTSPDDELETYIINASIHNVNNQVTYNQLNSIYNYHDCLAEVKLMQCKIAEAYLGGNMTAVKALQNELIASRAAHVVAAINNFRSTGSKTPGVDGFLIKTVDHFNQVLNFLQLVGTHPWKYKARLVKRVYIPKAGSVKGRPLGIPTISDKAVQHLFLLALAPIVETSGDTMSFGFRKGRGTLDAYQTVYKLLHSPGWPKMIFDADISKFFDSVSHEWILKNVPLHPHVLKEFVSAGFIYEGQSHDTTVGFPQGGVISPAISNLVLDGLQATIKTSVNKVRNSEAIGFVRYADDFVVTGPGYQWVWDKCVIPAISKFLSTRGLTLSEAKSKLVPRADGFNFLGWNLKWTAHAKKAGKSFWLCVPAAKNMAKTKLNIEGIFDAHKRSSVQELLEALNPALRGWANYFQYGNSSDAFWEIDQLVLKLCQKWAHTKFKGMNKKQIHSKHYRQIDGKWVLSYVDENGKVVSVFRVISVRPKSYPIKNFDNPYLANAKTRNNHNEAKRVEPKWEDLWDL